MNSWMKRRIERSRARCEKSATSHKPDKPQEAKAQPREQTQPAPSES
jgi:hypothetical protein